MEYVVQHETSTLYSSNTKMIKKSYSDFKRWILSKYQHHDDLDIIKVCVSTRHPYDVSDWKFWVHREHILVLDCDSQDSLFAAARWLKREKVNWAGIESSPDRFWIVTDKMGPFKEMFHILQQIPGVDQEYVKYTWQWKKFLLRAIPKEGFIIPKFGPSDTLENPTIIAWIKRFEALHHNEAFLEDLRLVKAVKNKTMTDIACDPSFDV